jgi:hypothetical protein
MSFAITQTESGFWGWMLMQGTDCIAKSAKSYPTELACRMEIERLRGDVRGLSPAPVSRPEVRKLACRPMAGF